MAEVNLARELALRRRELRPTGGTTLARARFRSTGEDLSGLELGEVVQAAGPGLACFQPRTVRLAGHHAESWRHSYRYCKLDYWYTSNVTLSFEAKAPGQPRA